VFNAGIIGLRKFVWRNTDIKKKQSSPVQKVRIRESRHNVRRKIASLMKMASVIPLQVSME
jgi:hypothetical protein